MATTTTTQAPIAMEHEPCIVVPGVGWDQFETICDALPESRALRVIYVDGRLTLLSPSFPHDLTAKGLYHVITAVADGLGVEWVPAGHTTYRKKKGATGVEGDEVFYFGANADRMTGERDIDLTKQPPPDLAVEVEATNPADDALISWGRIGVPEVWHLDLKYGTLVFGLLQDDGAYRPSPRSLALPVLEPDDVLAQLHLAEELGFSRWHRRLPDWVRDVLLPRRDG